MGARILVENEIAAALLTVQIGMAHAAFVRSCTATRGDWKAFALGAAAVVPARPFPQTTQGGSSWTSAIGHLGLPSTLYASARDAVEMNGTGDTHLQHSADFQFDQRSGW